MTADGVFLHWLDQRQLAPMSGLQTDLDLGPLMSADGPPMKDRALELISGSNRDLFVSGVLGCRWEYKTIEL
jgi:hypothetical protein